MPGVKTEVERLVNNQHAKNCAHLFRGFEHEMSEDMQREIYGRVVAPYTAVAGSTRG